MSLQFVWQGCDSILAAPPVLDLARIAEFAQRHGVAQHASDGRHAKRRPRAR